MTDNQLPPLPAEATPSQPDVPLPDVFVIPRATIERWLAIGQNDYVALKATRHDMDQLFFGLKKGFDAQQALQQCIIDWSNGRTPQANQAMVDSQRFMIEGQNHIRAFFNSLMASASVAKEPPHGS
jgi:hypothetical protein